MNKKEPGHKASGERDVTDNPDFQDFLLAAKRAAEFCPASKPIHLRSKLAPTFKREDP
jgi:hypothetical protein